MSKKVDLALEELALEQKATLMRARAGLLNFTCYTKPDYQVNWHHRLMAAALNKVERGEIKRLMINVQPRAGKSELVSRRFPAWYLGRNPSHQIIACSYGTSLAQHMCRDVQRIIDDQTYAHLFPDSYLSSSNVRTSRATEEGSYLRNADEFELVGHQRSYKGVGAGGPLTGYGASCAIIDDIHKSREEANSARIRDRVWDWYVGTFYNRLEKDAAVVLCMTRWHESDLAGRLLAQAAKNPEADQWTVLTLPSVVDDETELADGDPRKKGDVLWPEKYSKERLKVMRETMGERDWISLYQQRPAPAEGNVIKKSWWRYWTELPEDIDIIVASADMSLKDNERSDFTVITVWLRSGVSFYLVDMIRERMGWTEQKAAFARVRNMYPDLNAIYIEDAAAGVQLVEEAKKTVPGVVAVAARGSKLTRLEAVSGLIEAGNVFLPEPSMPGYHWVTEVLREVSVFPNGANDDIVDSLSMALSKMRSTTRTFDFVADSVDKDSFGYGMRNL